MSQELRFEIQRDDMRGETRYTAIAGDNLMAAYLEKAAFREIPEALTEKIVERIVEERGQEIMSQVDTKAIINAVSAGVAGRISEIFTAAFPAARKTEGGR